MVKSWPTLSERDADGVITIWKMVQHTDKEEVGAEGKSKPEVLLGCRRCKSCARTVRDGVIDVQCTSATKMGFRSIKPEETIAREKHNGVRDVLCEEGFC